MSTTPDDAAYEQWMDDLYADFREQELEDLRAEARADIAREVVYEDVRGYFLANADALLAPLVFLRRAEECLHTDPTAAHVFAAVALEVALRTALFRPVIRAVMGRERVADVLATLALGGNHGRKIFEQAVKDVLAETIGVDIRKKKREGKRDTLWNEIDRIKDRRNEILHNAKEVSGTDAIHAVEVTTFLLRKLLPGFVRAVNLDVSPDGLIGPA